MSTNRKARHRECSMRPPPPLRLLSSKGRMGGGEDLQTNTTDISHPGQFRTGKSSAGFFLCIYSLLWTLTFAPWVFSPILPPSLTAQLPTSYCGLILGCHIHNGDYIFTVSLFENSRPPKFTFQANSEDHIIGYDQRKTISEK
jgi:hypothetical protein